MDCSIFTLLSFQIRMICPENKQSVLYSVAIFFIGHFNTYMYKRSARIDHYTTCKSIIFIKKKLFISFSTSLRVYF